MAEGTNPKVFWANRCHTAAFSVMKAFQSCNTVAFGNSGPGSGISEKLVKCRASIFKYDFGNKNGITKAKYMQIST